MVNTLAITIGLIVFMRLVQSALFISCDNDAGKLESLTTAIHRTQAATERVNDVWCYECNTMDHGDACEDVAYSNSTDLHKKCVGEQFICLVKRFSYTTSTENSTSMPKMWSLDRRCTANCEPGCIVIGERTKLYACTSCCESSLCNTGRGAATRLLRRVETGIGTAMGIYVAPLLLHVLCTYQVSPLQCQ